MKLRHPHKPLFTAVTWAGLLGLWLPSQAHSARTMTFVDIVHADCSLTTQLECWFIGHFSGVRADSLPRPEDVVWFTGSVGEQPPGRSDTWGGLVVQPAIDKILGADLFVPGRFTQKGDVNLLAPTARVLILDESTYVLAQGTANIRQLEIGSSFEFAFSRDLAAHATFEQQGGEFNGGEVIVGSSGDHVDGPFVRPGTLWLKGGQFNANEVRSAEFRGIPGVLPALPVESILKLDGGFLNATTVRDMTDVIVGSDSPYRKAFLDLNDGKTLSTDRLSAGLQGGKGTVLVAGSGARLTASEHVLLASGTGSEAILAVGLGGEGTFIAESLAMADGAGSSARMEIDGSLAAVEVSDTMDVGLGGTAQVFMRRGGQLTADTLRVGAGSAGDPTSNVTIGGSGTASLTTDASGGGELLAGPGTSIETETLTVGGVGQLHLIRASVEAAQAQFLPGSTLRIDVNSDVPGDGYSQLLGLSTLSFEGELALDFTDGFVPVEGQRFQFFGFESFSGAFAPEAIIVTGFDPSELDFSLLGVDGSVWVGTAPVVPEPASAVLLGMGSLMLMCRRVG